MKSRRVRRMRHTRGRGRAMKRGGMFGYAEQGRATANAGPAPSYDSPEAERIRRQNSEEHFKYMMQRDGTGYNGDTLRGPPGSI